LGGGKADAADKCQRERAGAHEITSHGCLLFLRPRRRYPPPTHQQTIFLFDHLVGAAEQRERKVNAERLGGLEVDEQLDFCDLLSGEVGRPLGLENAAGVYASLTVRLRKTACVTHQAASNSEVARLVDRGHRVAES